MDKHKTCSFFGHRKIDLNEELKLRVKEVVENLIVNHNVCCFLFGSRSEFDKLCHLVVTELKTKYSFIKRVAYTCKSESCLLEAEREKIEAMYAKITKRKISLRGFEEEVEHNAKYTAGKAGYVERNRAMIDDSDFCVFFYDKDYVLPTRKCSSRGARFYRPQSGTALAYSYAKKKQKKLMNIFNYNHSFASGEKALEF